MEAEGAPLKSAYDIADESALPIDIPCAKLLSWLVDRQQLPPDWPKRLRAVRSKLDACLAATPDVPEVIELLSGTYIDYHTSTRVLAALKGDSTTGAKSWFGQHTDAHTIAWQGIVEGYASQNVYLGEYAQLLMQAASFDLPNMKKRLGKMKSGVPELRRKANECRTTSEQSELAFRKECAKLGIEGDDVESELRLLSRALPGVYEEVGAQLQEQALRQARELYVGLVGFVHKHESAEGMLPTLARAQANGVRCDAAADEPQPPPQEAGGGADIDWGEPEADNDGGGGGGGGDIDWGIETEAAGGADIDWGVEAEPAAGEIDWGPEGAGFEITTTGDSSHRR